MALTLVTAPAEEPVALADAKLHMRVDDSDENALITTLIAAARKWCENHTRRQFVTATYDWTLDRFPCVLRVPRPPLASVTSITYVDTAGTTQTVDSDDYRVDIATAPGRITEAYSASWPSTRSVTNAVTVRFVAGYGDAADVPESIITAIKIMVAHWYEHREPVMPGLSISSVPMSVTSLLSPYRIMEAH